MTPFGGDAPEGRPLAQGFSVSSESPQGHPAVDGIVVAGAPGETIIARFWIETDRDVRDIRIRVAGLSGARGSIKASALDVWVVKRWKQAGIGVYRTQVVEVDELLLKDDRGDVPLGRYGFRLASIRSFLRRRRFYLPPRIRLTGIVRTSTIREQRKLFVLVIRAPQDIQAGRYTGALKIEEGKLKQAIAVALEVWPIKLLEPPQDLLIWYKGTVKEWQTQHSVLPGTLSRQFRDIAGLGFQGVSVADAEPKLLLKVLRRALRAGLKGPFIVMPPYDERTHRAASAPGVKALYYVSDEPDAHGDAELRRHVENTRKVKEWRGQTICSLMNYGSRAALTTDARGEVPLAAADGGMADVESLYLPLNAQYFQLLSDFPELRKGKVYYYWMCHMEKPYVNRVLAGVYLWKSKADGIVPYCYQHLPRAPSSPFDDFADWEPGFHIGKDRRPFRHHLTTYPARGGSVWTLQWLGLGEGITDLRYLSTLDQALADARKSGVESCLALADEIEQEVKRFTDRIALHAININSETNPEPYLGIAPAEYQEFRNNVAGSIMKLQTALSQAGSVSLP